MPATFRTFLAVEISQEIRSKIERFIRVLQPQIHGVKWVEPQNLHVTLKFLGDVAANDVPEIARAVTNAVTQLEPFELEFFGCGAFPNLKTPRTLWISCRDGSEKLSFLAVTIENALSQLGYPKESRKFSPHLTIARAKQKIADLTTLFAAKEAELFSKCCIGEVILFSSELTRSGPIYQKLATSPLG